MLCVPDEVEGADGDHRALGSPTRLELGTTHGPPTAWIHSETCQHEVTDNRLIANEGVVGV